MNNLASDIIPLELGTKWLYRVQSKIMSFDVNVEVLESRNDYRLVRFTSDKLSAYVILKSDVDISVTGYNTGAGGTLSDTSSFKMLPKAEILKSPVITGGQWENDFGRFKIIDSEYRLKSGEKIFRYCIHLKLDDPQNTENDFYLKDGIGLLYARVSIEGVGKVDINLKKLN